MKILSLDSSKNNTKNSNKKQDVLVDAVEALTSALFQSLPEDHSFEEFECALLELCNEVGRRILSERLEELSKRFDSHYLLGADLPGDPFFLTRSVGCS